MQDLLESRGVIMKKYILKKENAMRLMFFFMCCLVIVQPDFFYAGTAGLDAVNEMMDNFYQLIATIFSGIGMVVALWAIGEIGSSWIVSSGAGGAAQLDAFKRMGGAIVLICAPQLVILFRP